MADKVSVGDRVMVHLTFRGPVTGTVVESSGDRVKVDFDDADEASMWVACSAVHAVCR